MKGVGCRVSGVGCRAYGVGCRVKGVGRRVESAGPCAPPPPAPCRTRLSASSLLAGFGFNVRLSLGIRIISRPKSNRSLIEFIESIRIELNRSLVEFKEQVRGPRAPRPPAPCRTRLSASSLQSRDEGLFCLL